MRYKKIVLCFLVIWSATMGLGAQAQKLAYSEPDRNETNKTNFEIIGKYGANILVYKSFRGKAYVSVYDNDMKLVANNDLEFMKDIRLIEADVVSYPEFAYLFYQHQKNRIVYSMAVKIGPDGQALSQPIELDTTSVGLGNTPRIYSVITSEDKEKILLFKVNTRDERRYIFKTMLFGKDLTPLHTSRIWLGMNDRNDFLTDFYLDNEGNMVFGRGVRPGTSENISKFYLAVKPALADSFALRELKFDNISLDELKLRVDNTNNRYLFTGFYYKGRRNGPIEGIANAIFDKNSYNWIIRNIIPMGREIREDAKGENNIKNAFDDYYLNHIVVKKDGGFVLTAESVYQTSRGGGFNRWDNFAAGYGGMYDYYNGMGGYGPYGFGRYPNSFSNLTRYHADNVMVIVFDKDGKMVLSNFVRKSQYEDLDNGMVGYQMINTGNSLSFLYNDYDKREVLLNYQSMDATGHISRHPTLRGLDKGYDFYPKFAKQVSGSTVVVPCGYRGLLSFAKLEL